MEKPTSGADKLVQRYILGVPGLRDLCRKGRVFRHAVARWCRVVVGNGSTVSEGSAEHINRVEGEEVFIDLGRLRAKILNLRLKYMGELTRRAAVLVNRFKDVSVAWYACIAENAFHAVNWSPHYHHMGLVAGKSEGNYVFLGDMAGDMQPTLDVPIRAAHDLLDGAGHALGRLRKEKSGVWNIHGVSYAS